MGTSSDLGLGEFPGVSEDDGMLGSYRASEHSQPVGLMIQHVHHHRPVTPGEIAEREESPEEKLQLAAESGNLSLTLDLLRRGGHVAANRIVDNKMGMLMRTPLHLAAERGHLSIVKVLLEHGASVNIPDLKGSTPLHWAASAGEEEVVAYLIEKGADTNAQDSIGNRAVNWASAKGRLKVVEMLVCNGAIVSVPNYKGYTPLHHAAANGHRDVVRYLLRCHSDAHALTVDRNTPLHLACDNNHLGVIETLVQESGLHEMKNKNGKTPWTINEVNEGVRIVLEAYVLSQKKAREDAEGDDGISKSKSFEQSQAVVASKSRREGKGGRGA